MGSPKGWIKQLKLPMPMGGLSKEFAYDTQPPTTTPLALNVWVVDSPTGRYRVGPRAPIKGLTSIPGSSKAPYGWCRFSYQTSNVLKIGVMVTTGAGTYESLNGSTWTQRIATTISETFPRQASCACYLQVLFEASSSTAQIKYKILPSGTGGNLQTAVDAAAADMPPTGGGTAPTNCGVILPHGDRLWAMNKRDAPHTVYASAVGNYLDWDYADPTEGGAFASTGSEGGILGEPALAAISHNHNCLLVGGPTSIYAYRGNPKTGSVRKISEHIGPLSNRSWCKAADDYTYFMSPLGLYRIPPGDGSTPEPCGESIPNDLIGLNPYDDPIVSVGYDHRWRQIHIFVSTQGGDNDASYTWKLPSGGVPGSWWKQSFTQGFQLALTFPEIISGDVSSLMAINANSTAYVFDRTGTETYDSYLVLGPFPMGGPYEDGLLHSVTAALAKFSDLWSGAYTGRLNCRVYVGESAEAAFVAVDPNDDGSFTDDDEAFALDPWTRPGWNYRQHPKCRGNYFCLKLFDASNSKWLVESIVAEIAPGYKHLVQDDEAIN